MADSDEAPVLLVRDVDRVRVITFNRPDAANAFNEHLYHETANTLRAAVDDDTVHVVVVTGAGRTFCGGTDLRELAKAVPGERAVADDRVGHSGDEAAHGREPSRGFASFVDAISTFPKPLLAAVNGASVGLGLTMLVHCDIVMVSERAKLLAPFTAMGVAPEAGSSYLLPQRVGRQHAARCLFASEWIDAQSAVAMGLAMKVCTADALLDDTLALAQQIASKSLASLIATKRLLLDSERDGLAARRARENATFAALLTLPGARDSVEGRLRRDR